MVFLERLGALPEPLGQHKISVFIFRPGILRAWLRESPELQGRPGAGMLNRWAATRSRRAATRADGRGQCLALPRPCTSGGMLAWFMAGMTAGWVAVTPRGWC
jgi:hypothetical protein